MKLHGLTPVALYNLSAFAENNYKNPDKSGNLETLRIMKIHFIGIGGIGVSALAKYYLEKGCETSGSDLVSSEITKALEKMGTQIFIGKHTSKNVSKKINLIIHSPAIQASNPEIKKAKELRIKIQSYPETLGELTKKYFTIAVAGAHGKSTTTSMIGILLTKAGFDPTVIVGTKVKEFGNSNCKVGKSKYLVIEACEHEASFLNYWPQIIVLTNIEKEHLDYYKNLKNILKAFQSFISHLPKNGILVINKDDKNIQKILNNFCFQIQEYFLRQKEAKILKKILKVPGIHNVYNALAALTVARILKIPDKISFDALSHYQGAWRRFEIKKCLIPGSQKKITIINDYGHHPTEVKVTLNAAREKFPKKKIWVVFQPHQYQRTFFLFKDFIKVLSEAPVDKIIINDIYDVAGREKKTIKKVVSSEKLVQEIRKKVGEKVIYISDIKKTLNYLKKNLKENEVLMIMGAGDVYNLTSVFPLDRKQIKNKN